MRFTHTRTDLNKAAKSGEPSPDSHKLLRTRLLAPSHVRTHRLHLGSEMERVQGERSLSERFSFWRSADNDESPPFARSGSLPPKPPRQRVRSFFRNERKSMSGVDFRPTMKKTPDAKGGGGRLFRAFLSSPRRKKPSYEDSFPSPKTISPANSMEDDKAAAEMGSLLPDIPTKTFLPVTPTPPTIKPPNVFKEDDVSGLEFGYVNEEEELPDAPSTTFDKRAVALFTAENRIRALQSTIDNFNTDNEKRESEHRAEKLMLQKNVDSFKQQFQNATEEIEDLTMQLKETRKRLTRRVRELEESMASKNAEVMAAKRADKLTIAQLRAECEILRAGYMEKDIPHGFVPDRPPKSKRGSRKHAARQNAPESPYAAPAPYLEDGYVVEQNILRPKSPLVSGAMPPKSPTHSSAVDAMRPPMRNNRPRSPGAEEMVRNITAPNLMSAAAPTPRFPRSQSGKTSTSYDSSDFMETRRRVSSSQISRDGLECARGGRNHPRPVDNRCRAARLSLRKTFVANIHSSKYRNMRIVWYDFLYAPGSQLTRDQFVQAVRKMPYPSTPKDQDIDLIRDEICGHTRRDEAITWAMFVRFYQRTKNEC